MYQMECSLECINFTLVYFSIRILQVNLKVLIWKLVSFSNSLNKNWNVGYPMNYQETKVSLKHRPFLNQEKHWPVDR